MRNKIKCRLSIIFFSPVYIINPIHKNHNRKAKAENQRFLVIKQKNCRKPRKTYKKEKNANYNHVSAHPLNQESLVSQSRSADEFLVRICHS
jgi:hypothetical protein